jgi:hypothetical protein
VVGVALSQHHTRRYRRDTVPGGIDFSACVNDPATGLCCVDKEEQVTTLKKDPILECTHKNTEQCHFTYVTKFKPSQEQVCEENFEKSCQITFKQQAFNETVKKCYKPTAKVRVDPINLNFWEFSGFCWFCWYDSHWKGSGQLTGGLSLYCSMKSSVSPGCMAKI